MQRKEDRNLLKNMLESCFLMDRQIRIVQTTRIFVSIGDGMYMLSELAKQAL